MTIVLDGTTGITSPQETITGGTANGVAYLNGSKVLTTGTGLQFNGANFGVGVTPSSWSLGVIAELGYAGNALFSVGAQQFNMMANAYYNAGYKYGATGYASYYQQSTGVHAWFNAPSGTANAAVTFTQAMTLDASGRLALGTTTILGSSNRASFANDTSAKGVLALQSTSTSGYSAVELYDNSGSQQGAMGWGNASVAVTGAASATYLYSTGAITFLSGGTSERARIDSSGNLLVGTTSSSFTSRFVSANTDRAAYFQTTSSTNTQDIINVAGVGGANSYNALRFWYGALGSGSVVGSISITSTATAYNTSSDYRLKNITGPITTSGAYIDSLNPVEGTWKADGSTFVGLIAHEVQEASRTPIATGTKDGQEMQAMDYSSAEIIANLIAELKSVRKRLSALEQK